MTISWPPRTHEATQDMPGTAGARRPLVNHVAWATTLQARGWAPSIASRGPARSPDEGTSQGEASGP